MSKMFDVVLKLKRDMKADWQDTLDRNGVLDDFMPIYKQKWSTETTNRIIAFIVFAYDNESGWIQIHKDRQENKEDILLKLGFKLSDKVAKSVLTGSNKAVEGVVEWFIKFQMDWRWKSILACHQYHSDMTDYANQRYQPEAPEESILDDDEEEEKKPAFKMLGEDKIVGMNIAKGKVLDEAIKRRREGDALMSEIKKEFVALDTVLEKEGKTRITAAADIMSHEKWLATIKTKK
jgi:hypothetical protein